ncbi:facilitated trehalose transporter Tret1-like [Ostrinia furnacalis]|uniref:facilitated trehalose transporter Tret1-like n=1 Tax=Ostrinia furnacalis TaxID=93504 RepID=UPI00103B9B5E|nr:facilitated trehalose transporter Tret1-like [Ostrinia furnacalis]
MTERNSRKIQYFAGLCASLSFMFTGATLSWPSPAIPKFKSGAAGFEISNEQTSWVVSLLSAGAMPGCYLGQVLSERVGRRRTFLLSSLPGLLGACIILFTKTPILMCVARFMIGLTTGSVAVVAMIYITEIADKEVRGALGMLVQVMNNLGSLLIYGIGPFVSYTMLNTIIVTIPVVYAVCCLWLPESPYYHLKDGRVDEARKEFKLLKGSDDEKWIDDQLSVIRAHVKESMENKSTAKELFTNVKYRKAIYIVAGLKTVQYMTGILLIQSYLEVIFRQSSSVSGPRASIVYGVVQLFAGIGATFLTRWCRRRFLLLTSCLGVSIAMTTVGVYFYLQEKLQVSQETLNSISILPLAGLIGFNILYAIGAGNLPYIFQAELFPVNVKAVASSAATQFACILSFLVQKFYQSCKEIFGNYTVFWSFACIGYLGVVFIYFCVPETGNKTLEEVQDNVVDASEGVPLQSFRNGHETAEKLKA